MNHRNAWKDCELHLRNSHKCLTDFAVPDPTQRANGRPFDIPAGRSRHLPDAQSMTPPSAMVTFPIQCVRPVFSHDKIVVAPLLSCSGPSRSLAEPVAPGDVLVRPAAGARPTLQRRSALLASFCATSDQQRSYSQRLARSCRKSGPGRRAWAAVNHRVH